MNDKEIIFMKRCNILEQILEGTYSSLEGLKVHDHIADCYHSFKGSKGDKEEAAHEKRYCNDLSEKICDDHTS